MNPSAHATDTKRVASMNDPGKRVDVANALNVIRPTLGDTAGVALYRLLRLVALEDIIGRGAAGTAYVAGKKLGNSLGLTSLEAFLELCTALKIGVIEVPVLTESRIHVDVYECITCAGLATVGRVLCHFEGGLIAGVVETVVKKRARAREVTCIGGLGHDACGFDIAVG
ncbi:MAG TPA: V4R domain-containing protein [Kofleriaceae bacterium]|nr:V4R domain-containing protein [Kofleriaceae bacterium]